MPVQPEINGFTQEEAARAELLHKNDDTKIKAGVDLLAMFCNNETMNIFEKVTQRWTSDSGCFCMIYPLVKPNFEAVKQMADHIAKCINVPASLLKMSEQVFKNTLRDVKIHGRITMLDFVGEFTGDNLRWETIGMVFNCIGLGAINTAPSDPLFSSREQRQKIAKQALDSSDACIACVETIDQLNDYRISLLFENFMLHSLINGDGSKLTCRQMVDAQLTLQRLFHLESLR